MAYGTTLADLLVMLKAEIGNSLTAGVATADDTVLKRLLSNKQKQLVHEYDFPNLRVRAEQAIATQYGTFPSTVSRDRPVKCFVQYNDNWYEPEYGIDEEHYQVHGPSEPVDPIQRWAFSNDGSVVPASLTLDRFEVWPVPANSQTIAFTGTMVLPALTADTDKAVLDDMMLVLFVASDRLRRYDQKDADLKLAQAQLIAGRLAATLPKQDPVFKLGGSRGMATEPRLTKIRAI